MRFCLTESDKHSKCGLSDISHFEYVIHMSPHVGKVARKQTVGGIPPISARGAVLSGDTPPALGTWGHLTTHSPLEEGLTVELLEGESAVVTSKIRSAPGQLARDCAVSVWKWFQAEQARGAWCKNGHSEKEHTGSRKCELAYHMRRWGDRGMEERAEEIAQNAGQRTVWTSREKPVLRRDREGLAASNQILEGEAGARENEATCKEMRVRPFLSCRKLSQVEEIHWIQRRDDKQIQIHRLSFVNCKMWKIKSFKSKLGQQVCICSRRKHGVWVWPHFLPTVILSRSPNHLVSPRTSVIAWWDQGWIKARIILPHKALCGLDSFQRINVKVF